MSVKYFVWSDAYSVNSPVLNEQHKKLFEISNELYDAFVANAHKEKLGQIIEELYDYTVYHFTDEERMIREKGLKVTPEHLKQHDDFRRKIADFRDKYKSGRISVTYEIMNFVRTWMVDHIMGTDKQYAHAF